MAMVEKDVVIIGAGIAGLATALALKRVGIKTLVFEKSDGLKCAGAAINFAPNAWLALDALGVSHKLASIYAPVNRMSVTNLGTGATQEVSLTRKSRDESRPRYIHRKKLLQTLADELPNGTIHFSSRIAAIDSPTHDGSFPVIIHLVGGTKVKAKILIGCDGIHSTVARWLGLSEPLNARRSVGLGLAVFPEGHGLNSELRQFVDAGMRAACVPLNDKEIFWFLVCSSSAEGENKAGNPEVIQKEVLEKYAKVLPTFYLDIVKRSDASTLHWAPLMFRHPWNVFFGNLSKGNVTVAGDAMHPMTPDLGQGGCQALEDAVVLGRHVGNLLIKTKGRIATTGDNNVAQAIDGYVKERKWRVTGVVIGSYFSGWAQNVGSNWWMKFLRDVIFYRILFGGLLSKIAGYNCGTLPVVSLGQNDNTGKID